MHRTPTKFFRRSAEERRLLVHAFVLHAAIDVAFRVLAFGRIVRLLDKAYPPSIGLTMTPGVSETVVWAVRTAAAHSPRSTCLTQALTGQCLLRLHGSVSLLRIGVSCGSGRFAAHAWLERAAADDSSVILGATGERFAVIWAAE
jgi:Transglutaminase-like superfamily